MIIKKIVSSLAFLMSLSLAAVANENNHKLSTEPLALKSISYVTIDDLIVTYKPAVYLQSLKDHLETNKEIYFKKYVNYLPDLTELQLLNVGFYIGTGTFGSSLFAHSLSSSFPTVRLISALGGVATFWAAIMYYDPNKVRDDFYNKAKDKIKDFIKDRLHGKGLLKKNNFFPTIEGEQFFNQFIDQLTNQSL